MSQAVEGLLRYAHQRGLLPLEDICFARNMLLAALKLDAPAALDEARDGVLPKTATPLLEALCDDAVARAVIDDEPFAREQFAAHLMNLLTPPPSRVSEAFETIRSAEGIAAATDWFYALCRANDYIRVDQIARNVCFTSPSRYGELEITINLSKPEKDPREIAKARSLPATGYPACMLCIENEGYSGRPGYPSHETLRMLPIGLCGERWFFQYSPYSYYDEHCIALNRLHTPMAVTRRTFSLLLSLVDRFPHYFFGSNADLPIVGGSILSHDHFQGGRHLFPMDKAPAYVEFAHAGYPGVRIEAVRWPMTCLRLTARDKEPLTDLADTILAAWKRYDDPALGILHETDGQPHNAITPIARRLEDGRYLLHLVLRNNCTTDEHPLGLFHPHAELHHIKRENIGLIEVMGLFILPGRLLSELARLSDVLTGKRPLESLSGDAALAQHLPWAKALARAHGTSLTQDAAERALRNAVSEKCERVLEDAGVYKPDARGDAAVEAFIRSALKNETVTAVHR